MRAALLVVVACTACSDPPPQLPTGGLVKATKADIDALREHRIFFHHKSVGANILEGVGRVTNELELDPLRIVRLGEGPLPEGGVLAHAEGGGNRDPQSKLASFASALRNEELAPEIAMVKLCYVDIEPPTDVDALFQTYVQTLDDLAKEHPSTTFVPITAPIQARRTGAKESIYRLVGRSVWHDVSNTKRQRFNRELRARYAGKPLFDLAAAESTWPDGKRQTQEVDGESVEAMVPAYTDDGGHLNENGQRWVASELIRFLTSTVKERGTP